MMGFYRTIDSNRVMASWQGIGRGYDDQIRSFQGQKRFYAGHNGFLVAVDDFDVPRHYVLHARKRVECIELAYVYSASTTMTLETGGGIFQSLNINPGVRMVLPRSAETYEINTVFEVSPSHPVRMVTIYITPEKMSALMGVPVQSLPANLLAGPIHSAREVYNLYDRMEPPLESAVFQILNCGLRGPARGLFIEGKALELLAMEIDRASGRGTTGPFLRAEEIRMLHLARQVMMDNMTDPPTLTELAREVGLNEKKVKTGFRALFGDTVYGFLQAYRMERARSMMEEDLCGVSEAAWAVGYVNVSHFSSAFRRRFGILPGDYLRHIRKDRTFLPSSK